MSVMTVVMAVPYFVPVAVLLAGTSSCLVLVAMLLAGTVLALLLVTMPLAGTSPALVLVMLLLGGLVADRVAHNALCLMPAARLLYTN